MRHAPTVLRCALPVVLAVASLAAPAAAVPDRSPTPSHPDRASISPRVQRAVAATAADAEPEVRVLVTPEAGTRVGEVLRDLPTGSFDVTARYAELPVVALEVGHESLDALADLPVTVAPDRRVQAYDTEAAEILGSEDVQDNGLTGEGVTVAVLDTGVYQSHGLVHPGLADDVVAQRCFDGAGCAAGPEVSADGNGHGTHVAGIVSGPNGVAPDAQVVVSKVLSDGGGGRDSTVLAALDDLVARNLASPGSVDLATLSLGGGSWSDEESCDRDSPHYAAAVAAANEAGIAVLAATGNAGQTDGVSSPACVTGVIGVGSSDDADLEGPDGACGDAHREEVSCFTNLTPVQGPGELVDVMAPGCAYTSLGLGDEDVTQCGTSMASPAAAGVAALVLQAAAERGETLTPAQLEQRLEDTGRPVRDRRLGPSGPDFPRVDARAATALTTPDLAVPARLRVVAPAPDRAALAWDAVPGASEYAVFRTDADRRRRLVARTDSPSYTDLTIPCGTSTYRVRAGDDTGLGAPTTLAVTSRACPGRPTGLTVVPVDADTFRLRWNPTDPQATSVVLERRRWGQPYADVQALAPGTTTVTDSVSGCGLAAYRVLTVRGTDRSVSSLPVFPVVCAPANDEVATAQVVTPGAPGTSARVVAPGIRYATSAPTDPPVWYAWGDFPSSHSLWYRIKPTKDVGMRITTAASTVATAEGVVDTYLGVYAFTPRLRGTVAASDDLDSRDPTSRVDVTLRAGRTYFVQAAMGSPLAPVGTGDLRLDFAWTAPAGVAGDELAGAPRLPVPKPAGKVITYRDTYRATYNPTDPVHRCGSGRARTAGSHTRWWTYDPQRSGRLDIRAGGSEFYEDVLLSVYRRERGKLVPIACDWGFEDVSAWVGGRVTRGTRYVVMVSQADERPAWYGGWSSTLQVTFKR